MHEAPLGCFILHEYFFFRAAFRMIDVRYKEKNIPQS
jgi:hypothetical protein